MVFICTALGVNEIETSNESACVSLAYVVTLGVGANLTPPLVCNALSHLHAYCWISEACRVVIRAMPINCSGSGNLHTY